MQQQLRQKTLLSEHDPAPVEWVNGANSAPLLLLCEHAGAAIPATLGDLGLRGVRMDAHRQTDIGAEALARAIAERLDAPLLIQRYSRLVIDCNRPVGSPDSVPKLMDGVRIPANQTDDVQGRIDEIFAPFDAAIIDGLTRIKPRAAISIHSFTPRLAGGADRPWHCGFLSRLDLATAGHLQNSVRENAPNMVLAVNEPYQIDDESDWFIPAYAEPQGLFHTLVEVRNDQLLNQDGVTLWADLLARAISTMPGLQT